jgi:acetyl-CoA synthetase (ADP-forming)
MSSDMLWKLIRPRTIALVGASQNPKKLGHITLRNLVEGGFSGRIFPINREADEILGLKAYPTLEKVPDEVDMAIVAVPALDVSEVIGECAKKGIQVAVILSAGFREVGSEGEACELDTVRVAKEGGVRLLGPNCLGVVNASESIDATLSRVIDPKKLRKGPIAFISQSGAFGASLYSWAQGKGISFDKLISCGNMCDIDESDILEYLATDENTKVVVMYLEGVRDGRKFLNIAQKVAPKKPIIVMKIGRSQRGSKAAGSHTGALTGADSIYDVAFKQSSVIRADNTNEMFDFAKAFATQPKLRGNRMVILTNAGGPGVAATDACQEEGLELIEIDNETRNYLKTLIPPYASTLNPIDTTPQISPRTHGDILRTMLSKENVDGAISIVVGSRPREYAEEVVNAHIGIADKFNKPVLLSWTADKSAEDLVTKLEENGVPVYETPERTVKSMGALRRYAGFLEKRRSLKD